MQLKNYKPVTPSLRHKISIDRSHLWKGKPLKNLTVGKLKTGGVNNHGRITVWHRGGGHKQKYRFVDFNRTISDPCVVKRIEYDPNRTSWIALIQSIKGAYSYILAYKDLKVGDIITSSDDAPIEVGNTLPLFNIPEGTRIHNIEVLPNQGGRLCRSAGSCAIVVKKTSKYAMVKLQSGKEKLIPLQCKATVGIVSNELHNSTSLGKAGASRWKGKRPTVRGVAMNPIDHPHGGGEGKTSGHRQLVTPWGKLTKGVKTRSKKKKYISSSSIF